MKCFYNPSQDAIGICKSCGKGLSSEFAVDLGRGLACKGPCEEDVKSLISLLENSTGIRKPSDNLLRSSTKSCYVGAALFFVMGIGFCVLAWQGPV